jgi:hypothetical protein
MVASKLSSVPPVLAVTHTMKIHNVFHVDLLTPYHKTDAYGEAYCYSSTWTVLVDFCSRLLLRNVPI